MGAMVSQAIALNMLNRYDEAIAKAGEAQVLFQDNNDIGGQAAALLVIGNAYSGKTSHDAAIEAMGKARDMAEEAGEGVSVKDVSNKIKEIGRYKSSAAKKSEDGTRMDIQIIRSEVPIIQYDAFEGRQMRTGPPPSSSSVALAPGD